MNVNNIFKNNEIWAQELEKNQPDLFRKFAQGQNPKILWIGCSDSRVPAETICGLEPGELFVHRNVANQIQPTDPSCLAVLHFAIDVLQIHHIVVCGHTHCGGVEAAKKGGGKGPVYEWIQPISNMVQDCPDKPLDHLCELNVRQQVQNLSQISVVLKAWKRNHPLSLHGWIYEISKGRLKDLGITMDQG